MPANPVIGIVGVNGSYGTWLRTFFESRMGLEVIGHDVAGAGTLPPAELVRRADVLIFCLPIRHTSALIRDYVKLSGGLERKRLWMDITSIKDVPVTEMLRSQAAVVGLHPMAAPPKTPTLKGRVLAVCSARIGDWGRWLEHFLDMTQANCVFVEPVAHDRAMALIQGVVHAAHLAQADVIRDFSPSLGGLDWLGSLRTVGYELDLTIIKRILAGNPEIYEDIQFDNPHVAAALDRLVEALDFLRARIREGGEEARREVRSRLLTGNTAWFESTSLSEGSRVFERLGYLLSDLDNPYFLEVSLSEDRPGSLRSVLAVFENLGLNLESIHSSRTDGDLHFRIGLDPAQLHKLSMDEMSALKSAIDKSSIRAAWSVKSWTKQG